ncbi:MAG: hypothetical protein DMG07_19290, partial [Acidobacteria bacterium]
MIPRTTRPDLPASANPLGGERGGMTRRGFVHSLSAAAVVGPGVAAAQAGQTPASTPWQVR